MKNIILILLLFAIAINCQTYKVDLGGVSNQYPLQIGLINGDVVITSTENKDKGSNIDAVHLVNITKNKSIKFANSYRQNNPRMSLSNNSILFSHREISSVSNEDISQICLFDTSLNIQKIQKLNFNIDTEIYSALQFDNSNYFSGAISYKGFISKFTGQIANPLSISISKSSSRYFTLTNVLENNNSLVSCYFDTGFMGLMKLDTNLTIVDHKDYNFNNEVKFTKSLIKTSENYFVLSDNYDFSYSQIKSTSIHKFDTTFNHISEYKLSINNNSAYIRSIKSLNNDIYAVGYYSDKIKSFVAVFNANFNLQYVASINDLEVINDICIDSNWYTYLVGTSNNNVDNGDVYYIKTNEINNICNSVDISNITQFVTKNDKINMNSDALITDVLNNNNYKDPSFSFIPTKSDEICSLKSSTPIQGIINKYIDVLEIDTCNNKIKVSPTNEYFVNDYVLMIQMQGAIIDTSNTPKYGDLIDLGSCGLYEFGYISKIEKVNDGSLITFKNKIINNYEVKGSVQLVGVPIYGNANVVGDILGKPWDGKSGGVIVVKATDTLNLVNGNIDASGIGFRGGKHSTLSEDRGFKDYYSSNSRFAGEKGEGIYKVISPQYRYGRGKTSNGGGAGNAHNGGGGGGSNLYFVSNNNTFKIGGAGGYAIGSWSAVGGDGGNVIIKDTSNFNRLILGGGGGGGHTNETNNGNGGNGGGIIIVDSPILNNSNKALTSNGVTAGNAFIDGGGGGGAGGTIILKNKVAINKLDIKVDGGNGGDSQKGIHLGGASGGGGTSGRVYLVNNNKLNEFTFTFKKGLKGYTDNGGVTGFYPGYDAEENDNMIISIDIIDDLLIQNKPFDTLASIGSYQKTFSLCDSNKVTLNSPITNPKYTYKWNTGETGTKIEVTKAGKYKCIISYGCSNYIAEFEVTNNQIQYNLTTINFENKCGLDSVQVSLSFNSTNASIFWFDGSNTKTRTFTKNGKYKYILKLSGFCDLTAEIDIQGISSGSYTSLISFTPDTLLFSNSHIDKLTCQTFTLTNVGVDTVTLSELTYLKKLNFSSPNSIFPITLLPKESKDLEVCFYGDKFKRNYTDSIRFDNCNNPNFLTLLADIPDDTLSFATRCMLKFNAAAPSKSIVISKSQLNEYVQQFINEYKLSSLLGIELLDVNAILPNQLVYLETRTTSFRILVLE